MRLRVCSLLLLFMALSIAATKSTGDSEENKEDANKNSKNVLIYNPYLGHYHTRFMTTIANRLSEAGHKVTMLDSKVFMKPKVFKKSDQIKNIITIEQCPEAATIEENGEDMLKTFWDDLSYYERFRKLFGFYEMDINFSPMMSAQCEKILSSTEMEALKATKFDLAITEVFDFCGLGIFHILEPRKTILASSVPLHEFIGELLGLPKAFDSVPTKFNMRTAEVLREQYGEFDFKGFLYNAMGSALSGQTMFGYLESNMTNVFSKYSKDFPGIKNLLKKAHSLMENVHPLLDLNKPTLIAIIPIGGITVQDTNTDFNTEYVESPSEVEIRKAKKENRKVVLVSFGTVMDSKTMTSEIKDNIIKALENVTETTFLWNVDDVEVKKDSNVKLHKWLPLNRLLASGDVDLFVSHMGIGSMTEAAYSGVPFVSIPIFVDQHYNYVCAKRLGIAKVVDKASLAKSPSTLSVAIQKALKEGDMKENSERLKKKLKGFGNQTEKMMNHINFILSLDGDKGPLSFEHHHHGFSLSLSLRSLAHLVPYYAFPVVLIAVFAIIGILFCVFSCLGCCTPPEFSPELFNLPFRVFCYYIFFGLIYPLFLFVVGCIKNYFYGSIYASIMTVILSFLSLGLYCLRHNRSMHAVLFDLCSHTFFAVCFAVKVISCFTVTDLIPFAVVLVAVNKRLFLEYNW
ncbi:hypothetical protein PMAYCL1PPCAC_17959 [Pristionchus mayeri]|uniref:glucuronosyltransferase n=1 Tax=Pristionchus mayeri TaxID=1317129 RepID=A0AAN5CNP2_9BILA|nr:hypothetical protein PMAYCL1PPCAC_17959 [Pristionchus mayeri]